MVELGVVEGVSHETIRRSLSVIGETDRCDGMPARWRLFVNQGGGAYRQALELGFEREGETGTAEASDINGDGWQDLCVQSRVHAGGPLYVYRNSQGNSFTNVAKEVGLGQNAFYATLADLNGEGRQDVIEALSSELRVYLNQGGTFLLAFRQTVSGGR
jgi:hypothetical protein